MSQVYIWVVITAGSLGMLAFALRLLERRRQMRLAQFTEAHLAPRLLLGFDRRMRRPLFWLPLLAFAAMALTLAQPHWGEAWTQVHKQSRDIMVVLDVSESMNAQDTPPSRLERVKQKIAALTGRLRGDRLGLIAFSGAPVLQTPLTGDHGYFLSVLDAVDTNSISKEGTDIAAALEEAIRVFKMEAEETPAYNRETRAILLVSDGEEVAGGAVEAARQASEYARVYVMGVGDPQGALVRLPQWTGMRAPGSVEETHLSKLDEDTLIRIATEGRGRYVRSGADNWDIDKIEEYMERVAARHVSTDVRYRLVNRFQWPLGFAIALFVAEGAWLSILPWLRTRRIKRQEIARAYRKAAESAAGS